MTRTHCFAAIAIQFALAGAAAAQSYPNKPIRFVVPVPAGSTPDVVARAIGQKFFEAWGQPVVADNRPGAGGVVALASVVNAPADGHTLLMATAGVMTIAPSVYKLPYDTA